MRRAKIVCTIGPATNDEQTIRRLVEAGMDVARLNFSHGTHEEHRAVFEAVRRVSDRVAIMQDLSGPKIRVGEIGPEPRRLAAQEEVQLAADGAATADSLPVTYPDLARDVAPGDEIFLADGGIHLVVRAVEGELVRCEVLHGGLITSRKGVNLPGVRLGVPALTDKDRLDLEFGLSLDVDYVALSFVRTAAEIRELREIVRGRGRAAEIVAKIEKREALGELDAIVDAADAIMVARGDLGVEIPPEEVPVAQKRIVAACLARGVPVITATQMLESMIENERPTRAEASDVANAVLDGTDAVMLSAETAMGAWPVETVEMMDRIVSRIEEFVSLSGAGRIENVAWAPPAERSRNGGVCAGAVTIAAETEATAIAVLTHSGRTARVMAALRPGVPVIALTDEEAVARRLSLVWGVEPMLVSRIETTETVFSVVQERVRAAGYTGAIVLTAGIPTRERTPTNTVHVVHA